MNDGQLQERTVVGGLIVEIHANIHKYQLY